MVLQDPDAPGVLDEFTTAMLAALEQLDRDTPTNPHYVSAVVVSQNGEPASVWEWDGTAMVPSTRSELVLAWESGDPGFLDTLK